MTTGRGPAGRWGSGRQGSPTSRPQGRPEPLDLPPPPGHRTFSDVVLDGQFRNEGFVRVPFLSPAEVDQVRRILDRLDPDGDDAFETSALHDVGCGRAAAVDQQLRGLLAGRLEAFLVDHAVLQAQTYLKRAVDPGSDSGDIPVHQDWSYVVGPAHRGVLLWCPLVDVDGVSAALSVVPRSHRLTTAPWGSGAMRWVFDGAESALAENLLPIPMHAGEALLYDASLVHASPPNRSGRPRPAIGLGAAPRDATLCHYHAEHPGAVVRYTVGPSYFAIDALDGVPNVDVRTCEHVATPRPASADEVEAALATMPHRWV